MIQRLTLAKEVAIILNDVFDGDYDAQKVCVQQLAELQGLTYSEMTEEEIQEMILEHEDRLYSLYSNYQEG
jgi:hypothetical protein